VESSTSVRVGLGRNGPKFQKELSHRLGFASGQRQRQGQGQDGARIGVVVLVDELDWQNRIGTILIEGYFVLREYWMFLNLHRRGA
jgi:hypothetical protein